MIEIPERVIAFLQHGLPFVVAVAALFVSVVLFRRGVRLAALLTLLGASCFLTAQLFFVFFSVQSLTWTVTQASFSFPGLRELVGFLCLNVLPGVAGALWVCALTLTRLKYEA